MSLHPINSVDNQIAVHPNMVVGFHNLLNSSLRFDKSLPLAFPMSFSEIQSFNQFSKPSTIENVRKVIFEGSIFSSEKYQKKEALHTFGFQDYEDQLIESVALTTNYDFSVSQVIKNNKSAIGLEVMASIHEFMRKIQQVQLFKLIADLTTKKQTIIPIIDGVRGAPAQVAFNPGIDDPTKVIDFSTITDTSTPEDIYKAVTKLVTTIRSIVNLTGRRWVVLIPKTLHDIINVGLSMHLASLNMTIRKDRSDVFASDWFERQSIVYDGFIYRDIEFYGIPEYIVQSYSAEIKFTVPAGETMWADYDKPFANGFGVAFVPSAIGCTGQTRDFLSGAWRFIGEGDSDIEIIPRDNYGNVFSEKQAFDMMVREGAIQSFVTSDFSNRRLTDLGEAHYTALEFLTRSHDVYMGHNSRIKMYTLICNDILMPNGALSIKVPPPPPPFRMVQNVRKIDSKISSK